MAPLYKSQIYENKKQTIVAWTDGSENLDILLDESRVQLPKRKKCGAWLHNMMNTHNTVDYQK